MGGVGADFVVSAPGASISSDLFPGISFDASVAMVMVKDVKCSYCLKKTLITSSY